MKSCLFYVVCLSLIAVAISETQDCDPHTGPAGLTKCFLETPYYSKHQCGTCLTDVYIRQRSVGKQHCRDRTRTYCYYQCMIEKYGLDRGPVYDDCLCDANSSLAQPSVILPAYCYSPAGTECSWYRECLARMFPCTGQAEYAISYGEQFCNLYEQSKLKFSQKALQWLDAARKCLQVALVPFLHLCQVRPTCEQIRSEAFASHVPCYIEPYQGFSVCTLEVTDWMTIFFTIKSSFVSSAWLETLKASVQTVASCGGYFGKQLGNYLLSLTVSVWDNLTEKRSADEMSDDELAHAIIIHVSSSLRWNKDSTVDWYAFVVKTSENDSSLTTPSAQHSGRELTIQVITTSVFNSVNGVGTTVCLQVISRRTILGLSNIPSVECYSSLHYYSVRFVFYRPV